MRKINEEWGLVEGLDSLSVIASYFMGRLPNNRNEALTYDKNGLYIDTCHASDTGFWETAIGDDRYDDSLIIVEEYADEEAARKGHKKWITKMTTKELPKSLKSIQTGEKYKLKI
jgi:hypothetical protein